MRGVIAPCHTHLKLSLPWRQWQRWIPAWQCNSRVSTSLHFHWAISTQLCHYPDRQKESTSNWAPGLEKNGESGPECWEEGRRVDRDLRGGGRGGVGGWGGNQEEAEESGVWGCTELAGGAAERTTAAARAHLHTHTHSLPREGQCVVPPVEDEEALSPCSSPQLVQHSGPDLPHLWR